MLNNWAQPAQTAALPHRPYKCGLDIVITYENYSNPGYTPPIITTKMVLLIIMKVAIQRENI